MRLEAEDLQHNFTGRSTPPIFVTFAAFYLICILGAKMNCNCLCHMSAEVKTILYVRAAQRTPSHSRIVFCVFDLRFGDTDTRTFPL
jgi:hypothetical protein